MGFRKIFIKIPSCLAFSFATNPAKLIEAMAKITTKNKHLFIMGKKFIVEKIYKTDFVCQIVLLFIIITSEHIIILTTIDKVVEKLKIKWILVHVCYILMLNLKSKVMLIASKCLD